MASGPVRVGVLMGSRSDWETMRNTASVLEELGIGHECRVISAHRAPDLLIEYVRSASARGLQVIVAGAGGAAHLPGMTAALTTLPVIGVPVEAPALRGLDALLAIVQMPKGVPVATVAIGAAGAANAAILAGQILALGDSELADRLRTRRADEARKVAETRVP